MAETITGIIKHRRKTYAEMMDDDKILLDGEIALESDSGMVKVGDGTTAYSDLEYINTELNSEHLLKQASCGIVVPSYIYPTDVMNNAMYKSLIDKIKEYETVPFTVILKPGTSGPGAATDPEYTKLIQLLKGAGAIVLGYISTTLGTRNISEVLVDVGLWRSLYPDADGIFIDEMKPTATTADILYYTSINRFAKGAGMKYTMANAGEPFVKEYIDTPAADVIIGWQDAIYPTQEQAEDYTDQGGAMLPKTRRGCLVHSQPIWDETSFNMMADYYGWVYVTEDLESPSPWDVISDHLDKMILTLRSRAGGGGGDAKIDSFPIDTDSAPVTIQYTNTAYFPVLDVENEGARVLFWNAGTGGNDLTIVTPSQTYALTDGQVVELSQMSLKWVSVDPSKERDVTVTNRVNSVEGIVEDGYDYPDPTMANGISQYGTYKDAAQDTPEDGTGGTASLLTLSEETASPIMGSRSLKIEKAFGDAQGEGVSCDFSLSAGQRSRTTDFCFKYEVTADYEPEDIGFFIYAVDSGKVISPSAVKMPDSYGSISKFYCNFQAIADENYRAIWHIRSTNAAAYDMTIDNIQVGKFESLVGSAISSWTEFTPTWNGTTTTFDINKGWWRREGDSIRIRTLTTPLVADTAAVQLEMPDNLTPVEFSTNTGTSELGTTEYYDGTLLRNGVPHLRTGGYVGIFREDTLAMLLWNNPLAELGFNILVPISQWSSNINLATDFTEYAFNTNTTDANDTTSFGYGPEGALVPDITGSTTGEIDKLCETKQPIQSTDMIFLEMQDPTNNKWKLIDGVWGYLRQGNYRYGVYISDIPDSNHIEVTFGKGGYTPSSASYASVSTYLWGNLQIAGWRWRVRKVSNGNMAEQPRMVRAEYKANASTPGAYNPIDFNDKVEDTHSAVTTGTDWKFTAPIDGVYHIDVAVLSSLVSFGAGSITELLIYYENGSSGRRFNYVVTPVAMTYNKNLTGSTSIRMKKGEYFYITMGGAGFTLMNDVTYNWITIERIGN